MIRILKKGVYSLIETRNQTKILTLDGKVIYAWVNAEGIGEILIASDNSHKTDNVLAIGKYRIYRVKDEPKLTDLTHLELHVGNGVWQGYLLTTGLPTSVKKRKRIIPTKEIITQSVVNNSLTPLQAVSDYGQ